MDGIDVDALAVRLAPVFRGRVVWRRGKFRYRVRSGIGKPVTDAFMIAVVASELPPAPILPTQIVARYVVTSDAFKEALG